MPACFAWLSFVDLEFPWYSPSSFELLLFLVVDDEKQNKTKQKSNQTKSNNKMKTQEIKRNKNKKRKK